MTDRLPFPISREEGEEGKEALKDAVIIIAAAVQWKEETAPPQLLLMARTTVLSLLPQHYVVYQTNCLRGTICFLMIPCVCGTLKSLCLSPSLPISREEQGTYLQEMTIGITRNNFPDVSSPP